MRERLNNESAWKWAALGAVIVGLEYIGDESLTSGVRRALATPVGKILVPAAIGVTAAHFYDLIPHQYDPYYIAARTFNIRNISGTRIQ